jgi:hypothetical protein
VCLNLVCHKNIKPNCSISSNIMKRRGDYPALSRKESKNAPPSAPGICQGKSRISSNNGKFPVGGGVSSMSHCGRASALSNSSVASPIKGHSIVSSPSGTSQDVPTIVSPTKSNRSSRAVLSQASVSTFPVGGGVMSVPHRSRASALSNSSVASPIKGRAIVSSPSKMSKDVPTIVSPTKSDRSSRAVPSQASVSNLSAVQPTKNFQVCSAATPSKSVLPLSSSTVSRLHCASINWLSRLMVHAEILKYESNENEIHKCQEDQLKYLMSKFGSPELKVAYHCIAGKLGLEYTSVQLPYNPKKDAVISYFIALIFDHRSMMYDSSSDAHW